MIEIDIANFERALKRDPDYPPGAAALRADLPALSQEQAWDRLTDRQRQRIELDFIDRVFDGDFLGDVLDAVTDAKRLALMKRIQGLWLTHRAVELDL
jgi:hypothetical protein